MRKVQKKEKGSGKKGDQGRKEIAMGAAQKWKRRRRGNMGRGKGRVKTGKVREGERKWNESKERRGTFKHAGGIQITRGCSDQEAVEFTSWRWSSDQKVEFRSGGGGKYEDVFKSGGVRSGEGVQTQRLYSDQEVKFRSWRWSSEQKVV